jgi:hypothetical protein
LAANVVPTVAANAARLTLFPCFDRVPDLTVWLRCVATSINRKRRFSHHPPRHHALQAMCAFAQFETSRSNNRARSWPQRRIMLLDVALASHTA